MEILELLNSLNYVDKGSYFEKYYNGYRIRVKKDGYIIDYGDSIRYDRETCLNLDFQPETSVVFQCVDKLLTLGYKPCDIYLEKAFPAGKKSKGQYLDILVYYKECPFMMIECKTYIEYNVELAKMERDGGQLFTYFNAERSPQYLCLYTSWINHGQFNYISNIIETKQITGTNKEQLFESWNKMFEKNGIFEDNCKPYSIEFKGLRKSNLKNFSLQDIEIQNGEGSIFNRFAEILRRNSISDKNNAYNKIFNLFLCKIVDEEERDEDEDLWFQWRNNETDEDVLSRLSDLYKRGMEKYLLLNISDYSEQDLRNVLSGEIDGEQVFNIFRKLRLYKNNEFAFNEVINERTFRENAKVVKEVVNLLENYQIKYSSKHQFLGDFFEKLLNIGVKQESGQFFTPIPIANFIVNSIPYEKIISEKIAKKDDDFLPYTIDYACGSGHFLTESMHRTDKILKSINGKLTPIQRKNMKLWQDDYAWAKEFLYGIELDYRLAKTTKVACYLNGDGDANIIYANGLSPFSSQTYSGRLYCTEKENNSFDIVIANPPYSVQNFMKTLNHAEMYFSLAEYMGESSDDIELLFIERTYQLLKEGGYCGIILPDTVLINNGKVFSETRKFILKNFIIHAIVHLGEQTFIKTDKSTIVLFMEKRSEKEKRSCFQKAKNIFDNIKTDRPNEFLHYITNICDCSSIDDYLKNLINETNEIDKFALYLLNKNKVLIARTGKKQDEIEFLGYKHTDRRRYEGIKPYPDNNDNIIKSKLYNENDINDASKVSYYIYQSFLNNDIDLQLLKKNGLSKNVKVEILDNIIDYSSVNDDVNYAIITKEKSEIKYNKNDYTLSNLNDIANGNIDGGDIAPSAKYFKSEPQRNNIFIRAKHLNNISNNNVEIQSDNMFALDKERKLFKAGTIVFPKSGQSVNTNNIAILPNDCYITNHLVGIYIENVNLRYYIFYILKHYGTSNLKLSDTGYPTIRLSTVKSMNIPVPNADRLITDIINEMNDIDRISLSKKVIFEKEQHVLAKYRVVYYNE